MRDLSIFIPSYRFDIHRVERLLCSINKHNVEKLPVTICVDQSDYDLFKKRLAKFRCQVIEQSTICENILDEKNAVNNGYINQQLRKLNCHKLNVSKNYLILDSDVIICSEIRSSDFVLAGTKTILYDDFDRLLYCDSGYYQKYGIYREKNIKQICEYYGIRREQHHFVFAIQVFNSDVLSDMHEYHKERNENMLTLMNISPLEYSWYSAFFFSQNYSNTKQIQSPFLVYHTRQQYMAFKVWRFNIDNISKQFVGYLINSKIGRKKLAPWRNYRELENMNIIEKLMIRIISFLT